MLPFGAYALMHLLAFAILGCTARDYMRRVLSCIKIIRKIQHTLRRRHNAFQGVLSLTLAFDKRNSAEQDWQPNHSVKSQCTRLLLPVPQRCIHIVIMTSLDCCTVFAGAACKLEPTAEAYMDVSDIGLHSSRCKAKLPGFPTMTLYINAR